MPTSRVPMKSRLDEIDNFEDRAQEAGFRVKNLAQDCRLSPRQLERRFAEKVGAKPGAWLNHLKLREAQALLDNGELIQNVAQTLGYRHHRDFSRWFKRRCGLSPTDYRRHSAH